MIHGFDELKNLRSLPFEQYFGEMFLTKTERDLRIKLAERLEDEIWAILDILSVLINEGVQDVAFVSEMLYLSYIDAISSDVVVDDYIKKYVKQISDDIVNSTVKYKDDIYYLSADRVRYIAENETNSVMNYQELQEALVSGKTKKTWITVKDKDVRITHVRVDEETIPIEQPFIVGGSQMMYPKDISLGAKANEIINCRCSVSYS